MRNSILILLIFLLSLAYSHECVSDRYQVEGEAIGGLYQETHGRILQSAYEGIRVYVDFSSMEGGANATNLYIQKKLVPATVNFFKKALKVKRLTSKLATSYTTMCAGEVNIPPILRTGQGVDADIAIIVTAKYEDSSFLAWARYCLRDSVTNRPVFGQINYNYKYIKDTADDFTFASDVLTSLHELAHVLAMSSSLYPLFINPTTGELLTGHLSTAVINGKTSSILNVEPLQSYLKEYFGCPTLIGAVLENEGTASSAGSHWERRIFYNEFMTSSAIENTKITNITLKLFESSGWYQVDYSVAEPFWWGKGKGCSFIDTPCVGPGGSPASFTPEFCIDLTKYDCIFSGRDKGYCGVFSLPRTDPNLDPAFDYWGDKTAVPDTFADNCPYVHSFSNANCENAAHGSGSGRFASFEYFGLGSRCFNSKISNAETPIQKYPYCLKNFCEQQADGSYVLKIELGSEILTCTQQETVTTLPTGFYGTFDCPDPNLFCTTIRAPICPRGCTGKGTCKPDGTCQCDPGYGGFDCATKLANCDEDPCIACSTPSVCTQCVDYFYVDSNAKCASCHSSCKQCSGGLSTQCTACEGSLYLKSGSCVSDCGSGYRKGSNNQCEACSDINCNQCDASASQCTQCKAGYFVTGSNTCQACSTSNCVTCPSDTCSACDSANDWFFNPVNSECVNTCPSGYRKNTILGTCEACSDPNCLACDADKDVCTQCKAVGYYLAASKTCAACIANCDQCTDGTECVTCKSGFYYDTVGKSCGTTCPSGYRPNGGVCQACTTANCDTCPTSASVCTACKTSYFLYSPEGTCLSSCPSGWRDNSATKECEQCTDSNCLSCPTDAGTCATCKTGFYKTTSNTCSPCISNCAQCTDGTSCIQCQSGYIYHPVDGTCVTSCPAGYRNNNGQCEACSDPNCLACPSNKNTCTSCKTPGYYLTASSTCATCISNCDQCTDGTECVTCKSGFYYDTVGKSCGTTCPSGYRPNGGVCQACTTANCDTCPTSASVCTSCKNSFFFYSPDSTCLSTCPTRWREESSTKVCQQCTDSNCLTCPTAVGVCSSCKAGYYKTTSNTCAPCNANCAQCTDGTSCIQCQSGYIYHPVDGTCVTSCPAGYRNNNGQCEACTTANCETCTTNKDVCTLCKSGFFAYAPTSSCVSSCPTGSQQDTTNRLCITCADPNCISCPSNTNICAQCKTNGYYLTSSKTCATCQSNCLQCSDGNSCSECSSGYFYLASTKTCVSSCPSKYRANSATKTCDPCSDSNCLQCPSSVSTCTQCVANTHYLDSSNHCQPCGGQCSTCDASGVCLSCNSGYYLNPSSSCVACPSNCANCDSSGTCTNCVAGYHLDTTSFTCIACSSNCASCNAAGCTSCITGFLFVADKQMCVLACPSKYYQSGTGCIPCDATCATCNSQLECTSCITDHYLYHGKCVATCPNGTHISEQRCIDDSCTNCTNILKAQKTGEDLAVTSIVFMSTTGIASVQGLTPYLSEALAFTQGLSMFNFINMTLPTNVRAFLSAMKPTHFDFLPKVYKDNEEKSTTRLLAGSIGEGFELPSNLRDTTIYLKSGFMIFVVIMIVYFVVLLLVMTRVEGKLKWLKDALQWNGILRISIIAFFPLAVYSILQLNNGATSTAAEIASFLLAIVAILYILGLMTWIFFVLRKPTKILSSQEYQSRYSTLYSNCNIDESSFARYYNLIMLGRNLVMAIVIAFLSSVPVFQVVLLLVIDIVLMIKIFTTSLFPKKSEKIFTILQQGAVIVTELLLIVFGAVAMDIDSAIALGWLLIAIILLVVIINIIRMLFFTIKTFMNLWKVNKEPVKTPSPQIKVHSEITYLKDDPIAMVVKHKRPEPVVYPDARHVKRDMTRIQDITPIDNSLEDSGLQLVPSRKILRRGRPGPFERTRIY